MLNQDKNSVSLKTEIIDLLPDGSTFSKILAHFYISQPNIFILHQLLLISLNMPFQDEIGNREILDFIKKFTDDLSLPSKKVSDFSFRKLNFNRLDSKPEDTYNDYNTTLTEDKAIELQINNCLLPSYRKIILSMEDLVEYCLRILKIIYAGKDNLLFTAIMEMVGELREIVDIDSDNSIKKKQNELLDALKEKVALVESLDEKVNKANGQERIELQKQLLNENKEMNELDNELLSLTQKEGNILYRIVNLCKFAINNCKLPQTAFDNMVTTIIIPSLKKVQFPHVVHLSLEITGLLAINHFNSTYKNFLKLFFDNLSNDNGEEFKESNRISLTIIFDSMLQNNLLLLPPEIMNGTIDEKIQQIITKYLYHKEYTPRVIAFMGLCKLLMVDRVTKHEFILSRLFVALFKSFEILDKSSEEYNIKIYEIMNNFMYFYSIKGKKHINSVVKAINLILTTQFMFNNETVYDRSVLSDYVDTKFDFLNQFLYIIYENSNEKANTSFMNFIFKIFKYIFFMYKYSKEEDISDNKDKKEREKSIDIGIGLLKNFKVKLQKLFEKTNYDSGLFSYFKENDSKFGKFFAFLNYLSEMKYLGEFSQNLFDEFNALKEKGFKIEINGTNYDFSTDEKKKELKEYIDKKEKKYYEEIEEFYAFCSQLKDNKLKEIFIENSKILEENEEEEEGEKSNDKKGRKKKKLNVSIKEEPPREPKKNKITPAAKRSTRKKK